jgi:hypothetical protein
MTTPPEQTRGGLFDRDAEAGQTSGAAHFFSVADAVNTNAHPCSGELPALVTCTDDG